MAGKGKPGREPDRAGDDCLAEMVANGATIETAAKRMFISRQAAERRWRRIRDGLGWQAQ